MAMTTGQRNAVLRWFFSQSRSQQVTDLEAVLQLLSSAGQDAVFAAVKGRARGAAEAEQAAAAAKIVDIDAVG